MTLYLPRAVGPHVQALADRVGYSQPAQLSGELEALLTAVLDSWKTHTTEKRLHTDSVFRLYTYSVLLAFGVIRCDDQFVLALPRTGGSKLGGEVLYLSFGPGKDPSYSAWVDDQIDNMPTRQLYDVKATAAEPGAASATQPPAPSEPVDERLVGGDQPV